MSIFKIDMHVHTEFSKDCGLEAGFIAERLKRLGFDGMCVMDHDIFKEGCPVDRHASDDFLVLKGAEYSSADGHILLYGIQDDSFMRYGKFQPAQKIIDHVAKAGGIAIPAHPYLDWRQLLNRKDGIPNPPEEEYDKTMEDKLYGLRALCAVESLNGALVRLQPLANKKARTAADSIGLKEIGGSDAHKEFEIGSAGTAFEDVAIRNMADLVFALRHERYSPFS